jgi:Ca2+-binding RTX toxin-like protein
MTTYTYTTLNDPLATSGTVAQGMAGTMATSDLSLFQLDQNDGLFPTGESQLALNSYLIGKGDTTGLTDPTTIVVQSGSDTSAVAFASDATGHLPQVLVLDPTSVGNSFDVNTSNDPHLQAITLGNNDDLTLTGHKSVLIAGSGVANVVNLQDSGNDVVVLAPASNPGYGGDVVYGGAGHDIIITTAAIEEYGGTNPSHLYGGTGNHQILADAANGGGSPSENTTLTAGSGDYQTLAVTSQANFNILQGGSGSYDFLYGGTWGSASGATQQQLIAGSGDHQTLYGGTGDDALIGGSGAYDVLMGGAQIGVGTNNGPGELPVLPDVLTAGTGDHQILMAGGGENDVFNVLTLGNDTIQGNTIDHSGVVNLGDSFANAHIKITGDYAATIVFSDTGQVLHISDVSSVHFSDGTVVSTAGWTGPTTTPEATLETHLANLEAQAQQHAAQTVAAVAAWL